ncbi:O-antigen ligase family protein [Thermovibrio sp.]
MKTLESSLTLYKVGKFLVLTSFYLLCLTIPTSIAGDNIAIGIGLLGFIILLFSRFEVEAPPVKPVAFVVIPEVISSLFNGFLKNVTKTDLNFHLVSYFVSYNCVKWKERYLNVGLKLLSFSVFLLFLSLLFEATTWQNVKHINLRALHLHHTLMIARGFINHHLTTAGVAYLLFFFFSAFYLLRREKYLLFSSFISFLSILLTQSRSYWLGTLFFLFLLTLYFLRSNKKALAYALSFFLISAFLLTQVPAFKSRFESIFNTKTNYSNLDRLALWRSNIKAYFEEYSLTEKIFGAGEKASKLCWPIFKRDFKKNFPLVKNPCEKVEKAHFHGGLTHNIYLKVLTKYGILGLLGFLAFWAFVLLRNFYSLHLFGKVMGFGYLGFLVAGFFENNFTDAEVQITLWFILGINFALLSLRSGGRPLRR